MDKALRLLRYDWPLHLVLLLTAWLPDNGPFLRLRGLLASHFIGSCGTDFRIGRQVTIYNPRNLYIGDHAYIAFGSWILALDVVNIGDEVMLGPYAVIAAGTHGRKGRSFRFGTPSTAPVSLGAGCWVGAHCTILMGSRVGDGSLIAAGSVVKGTLPSGWLSAGSPAVPKRPMADLELREPNVE